MNTKRSRILVIIPTLGQRTDLLEQTLLSVRSQLPIAHDIVMIFPMQNKPTLNLAKKYNATCVPDPGGISAAVNAGLSEALSHHDYVTWIGDDDLIAEGSFKRAVNALDRSPKASVAFGYCDYIDSSGRKIFTSKAGALAPWLMTWGPNLVPCPGAMFRASALQRAGKFDEKNKYSMDLDMFLRLKKIGKFVNVRAVQASFRWHPTSTTVSNRLKVIAETEAVKRSHLPSALQPLTPLWDYPIRLATIFAARRVNVMASKIK